MKAEDERALILAATLVRERAHAPFSLYKVGAALRAASGEIFVGCNVEISSFSHTCCAERVALFSAVAAGARDFEAVAVVTDDETPVTPCGACRQVLADFGGGIEVVMATTGGAIRRRLVSELLPEAFVSDRVLRHMGR